MTDPAELPPRLTVAQIREYAKYVLERRLLHGGMMSPEDARMVFLPLALADTSQIAKIVEWRNFLPVAIEGLHATAPGSCNGYPIFLEFRWVHLDDLKRIVALGLAMQEAIDSVPESQPSDRQATAS